MGLNGSFPCLMQIALMAFSSTSVKSSLSSSMANMSLAGAAGNGAAFLVMVNDLQLLSISHALMKNGFASLHDIHPEIVTEASHELLMLKELFHVLDTFLFHDTKVGG